MSIVLLLPLNHDSNKFLTVMSRGILLLSENLSTLPELDNDLKISLSQIESGSVTATVEGKKSILIKDEKVNTFQDLEETELNFEHIDRPEFPTVSLKIKVKMKNGLKMRYEHFFLTESPHEIKFLQELSENESFPLYFISQSNVLKKELAVSSIMKDELNSILDRLSRSS